MLRREWVDGRLVLEAEPGFGQTPLGASFGAFEEDWVERGWLERSPESTQTFAVLASAWAELGRRLQETEPDDPRRELIEAHVALLEALAEVPPVRLGLDCVGHIGASGFEWTLTLNGQPLDLASVPAPLVQLPSSTIVVGPAAFRVLQLVTEANRSRPSSLQSQLITLAELRRTLPGLEVSPHLSEFEVTEVKSVALKWERSPRSPIYGLETHATLDDGTTQEIRGRDVDPDEPVVQLGHKRFALMRGGQDVLVRGSVRHKNKTLREASPAILDPTKVIPAEVDPDVVDLSAYSDRVLGFEPLLGARVWTETAGGRNWFEEDSLSDAFLRLKFDVGPHRPPSTLELATPQEAAELASQLDRELAKPQPALVQFKGQAVPALPELKPILQNALTIHERASSERPKEAKPERPPLQAAIIAESVESNLAQVKAGRQVPWDRLESCLADGFSLQAHQKAGVEWLYQHHADAREKTEPGGVLIADEMGLGKTLQTLAFSALLQLEAGVSEQKLRPNLFVVPPSLVGNWQQEMDTFFTPATFRDRRVIEGSELKSSGVVTSTWNFITYDTLARHQVALLRVPWRLVVFDEAHALKNPDTLRSRAARGLQFEFAVAMTGTPIENRLADLWSLLDISSHGRFGPLTTFVDRFVTDPPGHGIDRLRSELRFEPGLTSIATPLIRRLKIELEQRLPAKRQAVRRIPMSAYQREQERVIWREMMKKPGSALSSLQLLDRLYQHPLLIRASKESILRECPPDAELISESPKLALTLELLDDLSRKEEKAIIFTPSIPMQHLLAALIARRYDFPSIGIINGEMGDTKSRGRKIASALLEFRSSAGFDVLVLSPLAAGVGLNITAATHVIHYGRWWNPAKEDQATDRAHRIGQTREVTVHYLILHHPGDPEAGFDAKLHKLVEEKRVLSRDLFAASEELGPNLADLAKIDEASGVRP